jgi:hypothetical protein
MVGQYGLPIRQTRTPVTATGEAEPIIFYLQLFSRQLSRLVLVFRPAQNYVPPVEMQVDELPIINDPTEMRGFASRCVASGRLLILFYFDKFWFIDFLSANLS